MNDKTQVNREVPHESFIPQQAPRGPYSFSQLSLFEQCPRKYWIEYVAKIKSPQTRALILGSAIHNGVEDGVNQILAEDPEEVDKERWLKQADTQTPPEDCVKDYKKGLQSFADWLPQVWEERTQQPEIATEWSFGLTRHWQPLDWRGNRQHNPPGMILRGSIDLLAIHHFDGFAYVWDLKTGRNPYEVFPKPGTPHRQLAVYAWALFCYHPHLQKIGTSFFNLMSQDKPEAGAIFDLDKAIHYGRNWAESLIREIEARDHTKLDEWEPKENKYCGFCAFKKHCPVGKKVSKKRYVPRNWNKKQKVINDQNMEVTLNRLNDDAE